MLCIPSANSAKRKLAAIIEHNNALDHKGNENVVGVGSVADTLWSVHIPNKIPIC